MLSRRSSEASSCLIRFCTGTLSAAIVRGETAPVGASPWRTLEALYCLGQRLIERAGGLVRGEVAGDISRLRKRSSFGPATPNANFASSGIAGHPRAPRYPNSSAPLP